MKKSVLMAAIAATFVCTAEAEGISSQNIVGYSAQSFTAQYPSFGGMFLSVGSTTGKWALKDWTIVGCDPSADVIQVLNPADANTDYSVTYISDEWATMLFGDASMAGWWKADLSATMDDYEFAAEQAFLASFASDVSITFAGQVNGAAEPKIDCTGLKYPFICNFLPRKIQWKELTVTGMDPSSDVLQVLNSENANTDYSVTYINDEWATMLFGDVTMAGWYKADLSAPMNDEYIEPGAAFLGSFANNIVINFPKAVQ